uniref:Uncharacterized protein n=1 Tax=viral metagenome TaxID=1070528 RepID=A0A6M3KXK2_9ZZZZ
MKKTMSVADLPAEKRREHEQRTARAARLTEARERIKGKKAGGDLTTADLKELVWALAENAGLIET